MKYLPQDFGRCSGNPDRVQCHDCKRNISNSPVHPEMAWQVWIGPWVGHGECPDYTGMDDGKTANG